VDVTDALPVGTHNTVVTATDTAGASRNESIDISVTPTINAVRIAAAETATRAIVDQFQDIHLNEDDGEVFLRYVACAYLEEITVGMTSPVQLSDVLVTFNPENCGLDR
jgi:hypothetical protein